VSGGHFNPAVSLGLAVARKFPAKEIVPYWIAQLVGGFVAVLAVAAVYSKSAVDALDTAPGLGISNGGALVLELIATGLFVMVICTVATDDRAPWKGVMAPLLIGLFIFTAADAIGPASGGSFNPARSLEPVIYNGDFGDLWIYLVGPLVGGVAGGAILAAVRPRPRARTGDDPLDRRPFSNRRCDVLGDQRDLWKGEPLKHATGVGFGKAGIFRGFDSRRLHIPSSGRFFDRNDCCHSELGQADEQAFDRRS
jgi:MIP family channel proteins